VPKTGDCPQCHRPWGSVGPSVPVIERMKLGIKLVLVCALGIWAATSVVAGETANLRNGYSIQFDRRELRGEWTRLYLSASPSDFVDVLTDEITGFEAEGMAPIPPRAPTPRANPLEVQDIDQVVSAASTRNNIPANLIKSVISVESGFNPNAVSRKGAQGLMQLMPETALKMGVRNPFDPSENVEGGARYLRDLLGLFHNDVPKALAAYNAGPERVEQYHGVPPYPETVAYVSRVIRNLNQGSAGAQQRFGKEVPNPSVGHSQKVARSAERKAGARVGASEARRGDFERHPLSIR